MVDSVLFPLSGRIIVDSDGNPSAGAKLEVFDAGTSNQQTIYSDSALTAAAANPIVCNASGECPVRYVGTTAYKVTFDDSDDVALSNYTTWDNIKGAVDTSSFLTGTVSPSRAVVAKSTTFSVAAGEVGKQINCDATGGDFTGTLITAVTAADGGSNVIKNSGASGTVTVSPPGVETIDGQTSFLLQPYDSITVNSDGTNWHIQSAHNETEGIDVITYAATVTPDMQHPSGTNYQLTLTGDATINSPDNLRVGTRGSFTIIQDGSGGHEITWNSNYKGNVNINQTASSITVIGFHVRTSSAIDFWTDTGRYFLVGVVEDQKADTTGGGTATLGSWETRDLNTLTINTIGITLSTNQFTLPAGDYLIRWSAPANQVNSHQSRLYDVTGTAALKSGASMRAENGSSTVNHSIGAHAVTLSAANAFEIQHQVEATVATNGYGRPASFGGEVYSIVEIYAR